MSAITQDTIHRPDLTLSQLYDLVNSLSISYLDFAQETHYYQKMFGVLTGCDAYCCSDNEFLVNRCLRDSLWRKLIEIQEQSENKLGYQLTTRYHTQTIDWPFGGYVKVNPGIAAVNIVPMWSAIEDYDNVPVDPFLVVLNSVTVSGQYTYITVPTSVLSNPREVVIRSAASNGTYTQLFSGGFPKRVGDDWQIAIDTKITPYDNEDINVHHCKYVFVDTQTTPECEDGTVYPVYKGTTQKIPQARARELINDGAGTRWWFYIYTLVDPAFYDETVNLEQGDFYKLFSAIEFKCFKEVASNGVLQMNCSCNLHDSCGCSNNRYDITVKIEDAANGVVSFCVNGIFNADDEIRPLDCTPLYYDGTSTYKLTFSYKTSPNNLNEPYRTSVNLVRSAMLHKVAAELPLTDCCCEIKVGFIKEQQQAYGKTTQNPMTQTQSFVFQYGDLHGQKVYAERMNQVPIFRFAVI